MEVLNQEKVTLRCVREGAKLRIRFHSYTNIEGKTFFNVYNNDYNCQFPRDIRKEDTFYEVCKEDITLCCAEGKQPFYRVKKGNVRVVNSDGIAIPPPASVPTSKPGKKKTKKSESDFAEVSSTQNKRPETIYEVNECVICLEATPNQIFLPCAHLCTCAECYSQMKLNKPCCPLCRRYVTSALIK